MNYNFTDDVKHALAMAREESHRLHHDYLGTEHLLLGLLRLPGGQAATVLHNLKADIEAIRDRIEQSVRPGTTTKSRSLAPKEVVVEIPYTSRGKKAIEYAMMEAPQTPYTPDVDTGHLLAGLLREDHGIAAVVLNSLGITLEAVRAELVRLDAQP